MNNQMIQVANFINNLEEKFIQVSAENETELKFKQESQFAIQLLQENSFLLKIAQSNPDSLKNAIINIGAVGLTLNPIEKKAYLIPRKGRVCLDVSYMGLVDIAINTGSIRFVQAKQVYSKDEFEILSATKEPVHKYNPFKERGEWVGSYCLAKTCDGDYLTEPMNKEEIENVRDRSESWKKNRSGPWATDFLEMAKKSTIRRGYKLWPKTNKSIRMDHAVSMLDEIEGIDFEKEKAEAEEQKQIEVNTAIAKEKANYKKDFEERQELITEICRIAGEKCEGKTQQEKGEFLVNVIKVKSFKELDRKSVKELEVVLAACDWEDK